MKTPTIKTLKELDHQVALGPVKLKSNIPGKVQRNGRDIKTFPLPPGGRIHSILLEAVRLGGTIARSNITKVTKCQWTSRHIAHAEVLGLIKRLCPYAPQYGRKYSYKLTKEGRQAHDLLESDTPSGDGINISVPVKVDSEAYFYHSRLNW